MSSYSDPNDFLLSGGVPSAKFPEIGTVVKGTVLSAEVNQQRDFDSGEPKTYDDGNPMMQMVVTLATDERDPDVDGDDGTRKLYVKGAMLAAVRTALRAASARIEPGGTLVVKYVADGTPSKKGLNPPKQYEAAYKPGTGTAVDALLADGDAEPAGVGASTGGPSAADLLD